LVERHGLEQYRKRPGTKSGRREYDAGVESFVKDLRHSLRMFRRTPGFTSAAIAALTLGIGTNTAICTVINGPSSSSRAASGP